MLVFPSVWEENRVVAPIIEVKVLDQVREESHLDFAEGDEKNALDTETSNRLFLTTQKAGKCRRRVRCMYFAYRFKKYAYLAQRKELTKEGNFPEIAVDGISNNMSNLKHDLNVSVNFGSSRSE